MGAKLLRNLRPLLLQLATGPRTLWIAGLVLALVPWGWVREAATPAGEDEVGAERRARIVAGALLAVLGITVIVTAITVPILRYLLPVRLIAEAAGLVGVWIYLWRMPDAWAPARARRLLCVAIAVLALGWGVRQTARGMTEAATVAADRGIPPAAVLQEIARDLDRELPPSEPVMSNLGPSLAWYSRRPVIHLALTPSDVDACRERLEMHHVVLAFRDASRAWPGWDEVVARPADAPHHPEWNVLRVRRWTVTEGFSLVWLELGPPRTSARGAGAIGTGAQCARNSALCCWNTNAAGNDASWRCFCGRVGGGVESAASCAQRSWPRASASLIDAALITTLGTMLGHAAPPLALGFDSRVSAHAGWYA
jgi:hypothetical protein